MCFFFFCNPPRFFFFKFHSEFLSTVLSTRSFASCESMLKKLQQDIEKPLAFLIQHREHLVASQKGSKLLVRRIMDFVFDRELEEEQDVQVLRTLIQEVVSTTSNELLQFEALARTVLKSCETLPPNLPEYLCEIKEEFGETKFSRFLNMQDINGRSFMHFAAQADNSELITILLECGGKAGIRDDHGANPLHTACAHGSLSCVSLLLETEVSFAKEIDNEGNSALMIACGGEHDSETLEILGKLLDVENNVNHANSMGDTCVHIVAQNAQTTSSVLMEQIIGVGADVNARNANQETALHGACANGNVATVDFLLNNTEVDLFAVDYMQRTALHLAVNNNYADIVKLLLEKAHRLQEFQEEEDVSLVDMQDQNGQTAMHLAAVDNQMYCTQLLIQYGAHTMIQDSSQWTPTETALYCLYSMPNGN
eukprot:TRINITY_DN5756_c1_g1_i3.p1 TRINITY_DN5756_c1_g1~~TRINITY_DN5756_c1_g1_i3.p1  ORF type:complete len:425 (+),score=116.88 TRINITY_DN5756_c1_g1_i3:849-2123(+)